MTLNGHGFELNAVLLFRAESGGSLPTPLVDGTSYYAIPLTDSTFSVSATEDGTAINLTSAGSNIIVVSQLPYDTWIEEASNWVECNLPAHVVPLSAPYPAVVVGVTADLAAARALAYVGHSNADLSLREERAQRRLAQWVKGIPVRGGIVPASANLSIVATSTTTDPRGWGTGGIP
jgi:hypothetical protein